jgi:hypothetical protein
MKQLGPRFPSTGRLLALSAVLLLGACGDDPSSDPDGGNAGTDGDSGARDAGRDAYIWIPDSGSGSGGSGGSGGGGSGGSSGSGGGGPIDGRMCAEPREYLPDIVLPRCSADTALCIAGCADDADTEACRDACIAGDTTPPHATYALNCAACIYLTLFACIDATDCHAGVAEVFCCIEDNCPTGSPEGCSEQMCGEEIMAALTCGYFADQSCVDLSGEPISSCFASGDEDGGV